MWAHCSLARRVFRWPALSPLFALLLPAAGEPPACIQQTYDKYMESGFSCSVGKLEFSLFTLAGDKKLYMLGSKKSL